jgi:hypothetical protein
VKKVSELKDRRRTPAPNIAITGLLFTFILAQFCATVKKEVYQARWIGRARKLHLRMKAKYGSSG